MLAALLVHISVYPNPSSGIVQVQAGSAVNGSLTIGIYNMVGELQLSRTVTGAGNTWSFDLGNYPEGIYLVQITGDHFRQTSKVTIRH